MTPSSERGTGRLPRFTTADAVAAALDLGIADFTLSQVARRLGVTTPALYRTFPNRDALLDDCLVEIGRHVPPFPVTDDWRVVAEYVTETMWMLNIRFPGFYTVYATYPRTFRDLIDLEYLYLEKMRTLGFTDRQATFLLMYIGHLTSGCVHHLFRQQKEMRRDAGSPHPRIFRTADGTPVTDPDDLVEGWHRQVQMSTGLVFDRFRELGHDWPVFPAPYVDAELDDRG